MAIALTLVPGRVFQQGEEVTYAKLNQLGTPVIQLQGTFGPADMSSGDYSESLAPAPYFYAVDTGVANAASIQLPTDLAAYADGIIVAFKVATANTGPSSLAVNGLAPQPVKKYGGTTDLAAGDWQPGQIVEVRYRLDANIVPAAAAYAGGVYNLPVIAGQTYTWTPNNNDVSLVCGAITLLATGNFTASTNTAVLNGIGATGVTATVIPQSNVWQMLSQLGNGPQVLSAFQGASPHMGGISGLVPEPKIGQMTYGLRGDGTWFDFVTAAFTAAQQGAGVPYVEIFKAFNFS